MKRRRKRRNQWAWFFTGIMFLFLVWIMLFYDEDVKESGKANMSRGPVSEKTVKDSAAAKEEQPSYLGDIADIETGTVLDPVRVDLTQAAQYFTVNEIDEEILQYINGKSYVKNDNIRLDELRYLKLLHYNYDHEIQVGELIVNAKIAEDCREVFQELFREEYEIESMYLVDKFWTGDSVDSDTNSIEHNNTSAFNYRIVPNTDRLSNHAAGFAIDVNPMQNPYVKYNSDGSFAKYYKDMEKYTDRAQKKKHMISHNDVCFQIFEKHGFTWGGDWNSSKDYQHFEKKE